jgi:hypothetical protein
VGAHQTTSNGKEMNDFELETDEALVKELELEARLEKMIEVRTAELEGRLQLAVNAIAELNFKINALQKSQEFTIKGGMATLNLHQSLEDHVAAHLGPVPGRK